jgi:hypothetical protein
MYGRLLLPNGFSLSDSMQEWNFLPLGLKFASPLQGRLLLPIIDRVTSRLPRCLLLFDPLVRSVPEVPKRYLLPIEFN